MHTLKVFRSPVWLLLHKLSSPHYGYIRKMRRGDRLPLTQSREINGSKSKEINGFIPREINGFIPREINESISTEINGSIPREINGSIPREIKGSKAREIFFFFSFIYFSIVRILQSPVHYHLTRVYRSIKKKSVKK